MPTRSVLQVPALPEELHGEGQHEAAHHGRAPASVRVQLPHLWGGLPQEEGHAAAYGATQGVCVCVCVRERERERERERVEVCVHLRQQNKMFACV